MLRLQALQLFNWGYAPFQVDLPIGNITLLQGRNGSGKTTYLNAIALLLGVRSLPKRQAFDKFVYPDQDWAFIRGIANNRPDANNQRAFSQVLGSLEDEITLACMVERKEGSWHRSYFIVPGGDFMPDPELRVDKSYRFNQEEYRKALAHVGVRDALLNLLELGLYGLREASRDPISRFQFFLKLVGNQDILDRYNRARDAWWTQRDTTRNLEERLRQEETRLAEWEKKIQVLRQRRECRLRKERAERLIKHAEWRDLKKQLREALADRDSASEALKTGEREIASNEEQWDQFERKQASWQAEYDAWRHERDDTENAANDAQSDLVRAELVCNQQKIKVERLRTLPVISLEEAQEAQQSAEASAQESFGLVKTLEQEQVNLKREQTALQNNETPLPRYAYEFVQTLREANIPYLLIADAVEITEQQWQHAVEGALGGERFTVIVEDNANQVRAKQIGQKLRYRAYVSPPNGNTSGASAPDSLWEVVHVSDSRAQGWVYQRLANIRRVSNIEDGHSLAAEGIVSITEQAYLQERRGGRSVWPSELVCGRAARQARLQIIKARLNELTTELTQANNAHTVANAELRQARTLVDQAIARQSLPAELVGLEELQSNVESKSAFASEMQKVYQRAKAREDDWNQSRDQLTGERTRLTERRRELEKGYQDERERLRDAEARVAEAEKKIRRLEPDLPEIDQGTRHIFEGETRSAEEYRREARQAEEELSRLPPAEFEDITEDLYKSQAAIVHSQRIEVTGMREREQEHRNLFTQALDDFRNYTNQLFGQGMHREFKRLANLVGADGEIRVESDEQDHWSLRVRVGFHQKPRQDLENAPLSQGQEVVTGLFLVLAALQAVKATPILLLDELMSTLDEVIAPLVLEQLRVTEAQCFVATPHIRPQADAIADVIWALQPRVQSEPYAPPVGVLTRRKR